MADQETGALGANYSSQDTMNQALGALGVILDPKRAQDTQDRSYWAGMTQGTHGGGRGEEMSNALKAQIATQNDQDKLKAQYIPLILQTLQAQRMMEYQQPMMDEVARRMQAQRGGAPQQPGMPGGQPGQPAQPGQQGGGGGLFGLNDNQTMGSLMTSMPMFAKTGESILENEKRTEQMKNDAAAGVTPAQRKAIITHLETKPNQAIAGMDDKGNIIFKAVGADPAGGMQYQVSQDGKITAIQIPGAAALKAGMAAAVEQGKGTQKPTERFDPKTGLPVISTQAKDAAQANGEKGMASAVGGDYGNKPEDYLREINQVILDLKNPNNKLGPASIKMLENHLADMKDKYKLSIQGDGQGGALLAAPPAGFNQGQEGAQKDLGTRFAALRDTAGQAQTTNSYLQNIKSLAQKAATGPMSDRIDYVNGLLSLVGNEKAKDAVTANDLLEKYGAQIVSRLGTGGLGTDAARAILTSAYPSAKMNLAAINEAADNIMGANEMVKSKLSVLAPHGTSRDPVKYQQKEQVFDANADPRIWQWKSIPDAAQRRAFATSIMKQDPKFVEKIKSLEGIGAF